MSQQPTIAPYPISDFLQWQGMQQLVLTPKFQRRDVWPAKAKSYLIDSILRAMPIPPIFLRLRVDPTARKMVREVVDGQQRLRAVLSYLSGDFPVLKVHNKEYGGKFFDDLSPEVQQDILSYKFQVNTLENIDDSEVLKLFSRLNTYTQPLKGQELINSEFFGAFKQLVYGLGYDNYTFWTANNILSDANIARMADAELCSEIVVCMLAGIRGTKLTDLRTFYQRYDDDFPSADRVKRRFSDVVDQIGNIFEGELKLTPFRRTPIFFSLFLAVYDAKYKLPGTPYQPKELPNRKTILSRLKEVGNTLEMRPVDPEAAEFQDASKRATADTGRRIVRHQYLMRHVFGYPALLWEQDETNQ